MAKLLLKSFAAREGIRPGPAEFAVLAALCAFLSGCGSFPAGQLPASGPPTAELAEGWFYRSGDSPPDATGIPAWARDAAGAPAWIPTNELGFATSHGRDNIWLNTRLPHWKGRDPSIFLHSVDLLFEAYLDGKLIYSFGRMDIGGQGKFAGWPWHIIALPQDYAGKTLSLRIFSDSQEVGIVGKVLLGSPAQHVLRIVRKDIGRVAFSALFIFIALLVLVFALKFEDRRVLAALSIFSFQMGTWLFAQTEMKQIILNAPMFWIYLDLISLYLAPATIAAFIESTYARKFSFVLRGIQGISVFYTVSIVALSMGGVVSLPLTIAPFNVLEFCGLAVVLFVTGWASLQGDREARILLAGLLLLAPFIVYDALNTWLGWSPPISHWGLMLFVASLAMILRGRLQKLQVQSVHDGLTGLANRYRFDEALETEWRRGLRSRKPLAIIMVDIDYFKCFNDTYGHQRGDECLKLVANAVASRVRREPDLVARFGGEEFVIMLPETTEQAARTVAERLRAVVDMMEVPHSSSKAARNLTISLGVAALIPDKDNRSFDVIELADKALYHAKEKGRNRVCDTQDIERDSKPAPA